MIPVSSSLTSEFLRILEERGFVHQMTDATALDQLARSGPLTAYVGYDCTAPSLHVGNLLSIMMLRWLQKTGHKPIVLMGGGTSRVGDPSGKDESRKLLSEADITANMAGIKQVFARFLQFGEGADHAIMVNNAEWLDRLSYIDFLRDYGRHFSVNRMLNFDSVRLRLEREQPLSFLEFNYMVLQAYDFVELARRYDCRLQMGGSDQWGNIVNGVELGRRTANLGLFGLTSPLITTASGAKMGKSAQGAVWLNEAQLSPYDYWQFWRNTEDRDVGRFLRLYTELPMAEIGKLETLRDAEVNEAKKILATEACALLHGRAAADEAAATAHKTFELGAAGEDLPTLALPRTRLVQGVLLIEVMVQMKFCNSNGEARRLIGNGGVRLNNQIIAQDNAKLSLADLDEEGQAKLSVGKKRHGLIRSQDGA